LIGHNQRLLRGHQFARDALARGEIGRVLTFETHYGHAGPDTWSVDSGPGLWFFDRSRAAFGAMFDLGIHKMDLIQFLLADTPKSVWATTRTLDKKGSDGAMIAVEDNAICVLKMHGGSVGTLTASWTYYGREDNCTRIYGSEGQMRIFDDPDFSVVITKKNGEELCCRLDSIQTNVRQNKTGVIDDFIEAVETGRASVNDMGNAVSSMRSVFACLRSGREGKEIEV
ncbi:MAG: Gfo/Idh/MocA family oxidoreductase, partial [Clostridiales bacterium]|nr:Gfo/Idh/MocA family oxidoreductase [Clostridiales bacterium]